MARVDTIELNIDGTKYKYNVNVGKAGIFKCILDLSISEKLGLKTNKILSSKLSDLKTEINTVYINYLNATTKEFTYIWILYKSDGKYSENKQGYSLFHHTSKYSLRQTGREPDGLHFDFGVVIKEKSSTGVEIWYETQKGQGCINFNEENLKDPNKYYKRRQTYRVDGKLIPYSKEAFDTLEKAREGIRSISEILFNFINQDENLIEASLLGGNLLKQ